jgi:hypothetical protein
VSPLQADEIFACLNRHGVRYVVIGGLAAVLRGSPLPTLDVDICPAEDPSNLERLAAALEEMDARVRTPDSSHGVRFPRDAAFLAKVELLNLVTRFGDLDLAFRPSGTAGYSAWVFEAWPLRLGVRSARRYCRAITSYLPASTYHMPIISISLSRSVLARSWFSAP